MHFFAKKHPNNQIKTRYITHLNTRFCKLLIRDKMGKKYFFTMDIVALLVK